MEQLKLSPHEMLQTRQEANRVNKSLGLQQAGEKQALGKDSFLKLLVTELKHQDPTRPMEDRQFIAQMAQFSSLEQMTNLNEQFQEFSKSSRSMEGFSLLGKRVDAYLSAQQRRVSGTVTSIRFVDNQMRFQVGNDDVSLSDIHAVHEPVKENRTETESVSKTIQN